MLSEGREGNDAAVNSSVHLVDKQVQQWWGCSNLFITNMNNNFKRLLVLESNQKKFGFLRFTYLPNFFTVYVPKMSSFFFSWKESSVAFKSLQGPSIAPWPRWGLLKAPQTQVFKIMLGFDYLNLQLGTLIKEHATERDTLYSKLEHLLKENSALLTDRGLLQRREERILELQSEVKRLQSEVSLRSHTLTHSFTYALHIICTDVKSLVYRK